MALNKPEIFMIIIRDAHNEILSRFGIASPDGTVSEYMIQAAVRRLGENLEAVRAEIHLVEDDASSYAGKPRTVVTKDDMAHQE